MIELLSCLQNLYNSKGVSFITNEDDTVRVYEDKGRRMQGDNSSFDKGMQALNSMDRINQVEILTGRTNSYCYYFT